MPSQRDPASVLMQIVELREHTLGYLRGGLETLKQCSLVCKPWTASTNTLLMSTVSMNLDKNLGTPDARNHCYAFLKNATRITDCASKLVMFDERYYGDIRRADLELGLDVLATLLTFFPKLRELVINPRRTVFFHQQGVLEQVEDYGSGRDAQPPQAAPCPQPTTTICLRQLELYIRWHTCRFVSPKEIAALFPSIELLKLVQPPILVNRQPFDARSRIECYAEPGSIPGVTTLILQAYAAQLRFTYLHHVHLAPSDPYDHAVQGDNGRSVCLFELARFSKIKMIGFSPYIGDSSAEVFTKEFAADIGELVLSLNGNLAEAATHRQQEPPVEERQLTYEEARSSSFGLSLICVCKRLEDLRLDLPVSAASEAPLSAESQSPDYAHWYNEHIWEAFLDVLVRLPLPPSLRKLCLSVRTYPRKTPQRRSSPKLRKEIETAEKQAIKQTLAGLNWGKINEIVDKYSASLQILELQLPETGAGLETQEQLVKSQLSRSALDLTRFATSVPLSRKE